MINRIVMVGVVSLLLLVPGSSSPGQPDRLGTSESLGAEKTSGCQSEVERLKAELERVRGGGR